MGIAIQNASLIHSNINPASQKPENWINLVSKLCAGTAWHSCTIV